MPVLSPAATRRILVVDDDEGLLILMTDILRAEGYVALAANSARAAHEILRSDPPDLMILDLKLQDAEGPALVASFQDEGAAIPFVVVTGQGDEKVAVEVMKQGALDYVMKDTGLLDLLPLVVAQALRAVDQKQALKAAQLEHRHLEREVLEITERERHSIGADLHDNLGQRLTALELMCTALKEDARSEPALAKRLDVMGRMLREAISQTRSLARGLVPVGSEPDALQNGLTELANQNADSGHIAWHFECPHPVMLSDAFAAGHLYRIAQESVNNVLKHARATEIVIRLSVKNETLILEISDNGVGLPKKTGGGRGIGLGVMRHRASAIGATLLIESKKGTGVTVRCSLPLSR